MGANVISAAAVTDATSKFSVLKFFIVLSLAASSRYALHSYSSSVAFGSLCR